MDKGVLSMKLWRFAGLVVISASLICGVTLGGVTGADILARTGVKGGLLVHLGCGDGRLTAALRANDSYTVHGLDKNGENIAKARKHIKSLRLYGNVSVEQWAEKHLPYRDNLVNLVVCEDIGNVSMKEVMRVLCPKGVAYIKSGGKWKKTVKPWPDDIDEWTHYLYDSTGNAVSSDERVGPPRNVQWIGSPRWSRHHDRMASMSALVSAGGRIFYVFDEGSTASIILPPKHMLIARDAFNGVVLWKREIPSWFNHMIPYKSGHGQMPRRLVAVAERVYVTLGLNEGLVALDAATGKTVKTYPGTENTREIIVCGGKVFALVDPEPMLANDFRPDESCMHKERNRVERIWPWKEHPCHIKAFDAESGEMEWESCKSVVPLTMAADDKGVYFHDGEKIVRLDRKNGDEVWSSETVSRKSSMPTNFGPTLVLYDDVVMFSGGDRKMAALSAKTGKILWGSEHPPSGHHSPEDLMVIDGMVWAGDIANKKSFGVFTARDLHSGEIKKEFAPDVKTFWFHHRCYRSKATKKYLMPSRTGIEYVDIKNEHWDINHWVRGGCLYGVMPSNGLTYAPPHSCACYTDAKMNGFCALSATVQEAQSSESRRFEKGPAYGKVPDNLRAKDHDWPTYRHDGSRSGSTNASVSGKLETKWRAKLGGRLSSLVLAEGKVFVASIDTHTVYAMDSQSGDKAWSYTAGARVDSPPTIYKGRVIFGSADGWVYCLRALDGKMAWRYRVAPTDRRVMNFEQLGIGVAGSRKRPCRRWRGLLPCRQIDVYRWRDTVC